MTTEKLLRNSYVSSLTIYCFTTSTVHYLVSASILRCLHVSGLGV